MSGDGVTLEEINSADWSLALDRNGGIGRVVEGIEDVNQAIEIILTTPKGSDPLRPTFGADLFQFIDFPLTAALPGIVREVSDAIRLWEPRVRLLSVSAEPALGGTTQKGAHLNVSMAWELRLGERASTRAATTVRIGG